MARVVDVSLDYSTSSVMVKLATQHQLSSDDYNLFVQ